MKLLRRTAFIAAATLALAPPAFAQKSADTLRILFQDAVPNVDMYFNSQRTGLILAHQAWDMLVHRDPATFEIKPALATDWKFAEDNSLDLTIRQGVKFHDGSTLSADDVVYTINMAASPDSKVATPSNYAWIDKAEKTGDFTVRIKMKRPTPAALEYLAMVTPIHPKAYREKVGPEGFAAKPVGAGPYKIVTQRAGQGSRVRALRRLLGGLAQGQARDQDAACALRARRHDRGDGALGPARRLGVELQSRPARQHQQDAAPAGDAAGIDAHRLSLDRCRRPFGQGQSADQPEGAPGDLARHQPPGHGRQADPGWQPRAAWRRASPPSSAATPTPR